MATFQLSSVASLNFGRSQNTVLGNGLNYYGRSKCKLLAERSSLRSSERKQKTERPGNFLEFMFYQRLGSIA